MNYSSTSKYFNPLSWIAKLLDHDDTDASNKQIMDSYAGASSIGNQSEEYIKESQRERMLLNKLSSYSLNSVMQNHQENASTDASNKGLICSEFPLVTSPSSVALSCSETPSHSETTRLSETSPSPKINTAHQLNTMWLDRSYKRKLCPPSKSSDVAASSSKSDEDDWPVLIPSKKFASPSKIITSNEVQTPHCLEDYDVYITEVFIPQRRDPIRRNMKDTKFCSQPQSQDSQIFDDTNIFQIKNEPTENFMPVNSVTQERNMNTIQIKDEPTEKSKPMDSDIQSIIKSELSKCFREVYPTKKWGFDKLSDKDETKSPVKPGDRSVSSLIVSTTPSSSVTQYATADHTMDIRPLVAVPIYTPDRKLIDDANIFKTNHEPTESTHSVALDRNMNTILIKNKPTKKSKPINSDIQSIIENGFEELLKEVNPAKNWIFGKLSNKDETKSSVKPGDRSDSSPTVSTTPSSSVTQYATADHTMDIRESDTETGVKEAQHSGPTVAVPAITYLYALCNVCKSSDIDIKFATCSSHHKICKSCVQPKVDAVFLDGQTMHVFNFQMHVYCPEGLCQGIIAIDSLESLLDNSLFSLLKLKIQQNENEASSRFIQNMEGIFSCPSCSFKVLLDRERLVYTCRNKACSVKCCRYCKCSIQPQDKHEECWLLDLAGTECLEDISKLPVNWKWSSTTGCSFELVELDSTGEEFQKWSTFLNKTTCTKVLNIWNVQNKMLWEKYVLKRKHMKEELGMADIKERLLFHGTDASNVNAICTQGFDMRVPTINGQRFGKGIYFSTWAQYSQKYSRQGKMMFITRVLCGKSCLGNPSLTRPPPDQSGRLYDTCVDSPMAPSMYVVFDNSQCYPGILIWWE
ncbi:uncharacterized protein LOC131936872 [Physella acuta]|uniref:uncharacterized protein LOC131936872 n=1 Tax=Physella acuta TaxID=109671 RepID=UPI0027DC6B8E|nr:uncharacterized protein LOC131936872 [Physella acuta]